MTPKMARPSKTNGPKKPSVRKVMTTVIATRVSTATARASTTTVSGIHEVLSTFKGEEQA
jgi:hypothetical protein